MTIDTSIQLIRNAALVINYAGKKILVDPMLAPKDAYDSFTGAARNPMVDLPLPVEDITKDIDLVLVTHTHRDHFDPVASQALDKSVKLINQPADKVYFKEEGFINAETVEESTVWNGISIYRTGGEHGSGEVLKLMGTVSGFILKAEGQPTVYIVGDSIWIPLVAQRIEQFKPDYIVINSGGAIWPGYEATPILMEENQVMQLMNESGKAKIIAVHMEALDHCHTTRASLRRKANESSVSADKLIIPANGETVML
ncbi:MBL fold metallo-hydrolase [Chitinophaga sp. CF418]|uniref:MBL fold metallo-hydrolase n=1 Tax=Chitinophaga sp. CF418 TaxID=1855287 RepID=UPI00092137F4|nr:MBL fold metallo-hydrolase [Chitinophaga sp. CF418]SHN33643.1 L-ascorbate metabolism protein UlaG, beta-lactamase superfamily [Chitinophaga sp. CF418]